MNDPDEIKLKAELDEITVNIRNIMNKIESVMPEKTESPERNEQNPDSGND